MNPNFLIAAGVTVVLLIALGIVGGLKADLATVSIELANYEHQLQQNKPKVEEIRRQRASIRFWGEALAAVENVNRNRILWSRQLEALALSVPEQMTLSILGVRTVNAALPQATGEDTNVQRFGTRYEVRFQGRVADSQASSIIRSFSQQAPDVPGFAGRLEGIELSSESPLRRGAGPGKEFVLTARYKAIDWQKGETQ